MIYCQDFLCIFAAMPILSEMIKKGDEYVFT